MKRPSRRAAESPATPEFEVAVIGAGPGGIAAGVKLKRAKIEDFVIIDRDTDFGGSWHENHYPGLGVDIPWPAYQFSFERKTDWSRFFPKGPEVKQYHVEVARKYGLYPHARFQTRIVKEEFDDERHYWKLHTAEGTVLTARFLINAVGAFVRPRSDSFTGVEGFQGEILRPHNWNDDYDLKGKRVGVVGTGASAVQIIPAIRDEVAAMTVFQRTPVWSFPKPDFQTPTLMKRLLALPGVLPIVHGTILVGVDLALRGLVSAPNGVLRPALSLVDRAAIAAYRRLVGLIVKDPATAAQLSPNFGFIAKRPTMNTQYLPTFNHPHVQLVTEPIERITAKGIRTADGVEREFDAIVLATGYEVFSDPETYRPGTIVGRSGFDLGKFYTAEGLQAYQSVSVHGLPNRWTLVGPYSWTGSGWHDFVEMTADHAARAIKEAKRRKATLMEIRRDVAEDYHRKIYQQNEIVRYYMTELNGHTPTYYRNSQGESTYIRPTGFFEARRGHRKFPFDHYSYEVLRAGAVAAEPEGTAVESVSEVSA
ncbi:NAD(P)/FAD-dependent oxidoreductase [Nocardia uniformis]|uniref:NAD(P)/FAD-dependent oxidoreductase n=1 Tax=Nocardia uniformis TaxID=53432 RepID=A0A849BWH8_9NOCA|nr:NAD(P)/FAD-dependent oxidoreductase [Nocardia uniformis]NNH70953.1 NAD(P)/FAD-dependent oxidoreductase [Nocardia uniformis]